MSEKNTAKDTASPRCRNACAGQRSGKTVVPDRETLLDKAAVAEQGLQRKPLSVQGIRLNKTIAQAGYCSRRKADELIFSGQVLVNGCVEQNPARHVLPDDAITVNGHPLSAAQEFCYLLLHKPVQTVCTVSDPEGRPTVMDCLPATLQGLRLYPVGRLDYFSEGLLLLTNDGELAQRLTHPRHHQPKMYEVLVRGPVNAGALERMRRGMRLAEGEDLLPVEVEKKETQEGDSLLQMVLRQGLNRADPTDVP